jgi:hypothetical protein
MKSFGIFFVCVACFLGGSRRFADAFISAHAVRLSSSSLPVNNNNFDAEAYAKSMSAAAIDQMKNLKPEDLDKMIAEIDSMGGVQKAALKAMNMDVSFVLCPTPPSPRFDSYPPVFNFWPILPYSPARDDEEVASNDEG